MPLCPMISFKTKTGQKPANTVGRPRRATRISGLNRLNLKQFPKIPDKQKARRNHCAGLFSFTMDPLATTCEAGHSSRPTSQKTARRDLSGLFQNVASLHGIADFIHQRNQVRLRTVVGFFHDDCAGRGQRAQ